MPLAEHNNMVKTIPSDRTDEPLRISVLPWRPWRDRPIPYTHCSKPLDDDIAIDAIPIANDISWRLLPAVGFGQLTGNPMGARACGHTQPQKLAAGMLQDQKSIQQSTKTLQPFSVPCGPCSLSDAAAAVCSTIDRVVANLQKIRV